MTTEEKADAMKRGYAAGAAAEAVLQWLDTQWPRAAGMLTRDARIRLRAFVAGEVSKAVEECEK